jgi:hypothetical protein
MEEPNINIVDSNPRERNIVGALLVVAAEIRVSRTNEKLSEALRSVIGQWTEITAVLERAAKEADAKRQGAGFSPKAR